MAQLIDATRIANEPELRYTPDGTAVLNLSLPCDYGRKGQDGKKPTQWLDASLWGKQAEALAPYLLKGQFIAFTLDDVHNEEYQSQGGTRTKLVGRVSHIKLIGSRPDSQQTGQQKPAPQPRENRSASAPAPVSGGGGFDDFDDIPFAQFMRDEF